MIYAMMAAFAAGVALLAVAELLCRYLQKQTEQMGSTNDKLLKQLRLKFENCKKLRNDIEDLDVFIERYLYKYRFLGLSLIGWSHTTELMLLAAGGIGVAAIRMHPEGTRDYMLTWAIGSVLLLILSRIQDMPAKQRRMRVNIKDYLENTLAGRQQQTSALMPMPDGTEYAAMQQVDVVLEPPVFTEEDNEVLEQLLKQILA